ncbi:LysR substrate-binding domain-containing protein [Leisingera sp. M527]|uniref:LysR family transcriptional regulator n=1 Tax=Leisingera sp. M527 TaxID=2867014 RepID=UPI0021A55109|nr:LysR substrate-binding domain-containing protein [Leisingera sp. M527]
MKFKLRQLEAFQAVARTGSVTRAAESLGISQPAASRLLSDFSKTVAVDLFTRKDGLLIPTSEARYLLSEVGRVFDSLNHLEELNRDLTERTAGHLRIACLPGFATALLPKLLAGFLEHRPGVRLTLEPDRPERILEWIIGEQYDCGITDGFAAHPAVENIDIPVRTVCVLPQDDPLAEQDVITPRDLQHRKIITPAATARFSASCTNRFRGRGELNSWIEVRQFSTACIMVGQGQGASVVSALDAEQFRGQALPLCHSPPSCITGCRSCGRCRAAGRCWR